MGKLVLRCVRAGRSGLEGLTGVPGSRKVIKDRKGRIPAIELMINNPLIADLVFKGEVHEIKEVMKRSREQVMQTFDQSLFDLHEREQISYEDALRNADSKNELRLRIKLESKREVKNLDDGGALTIIDEEQQGRSF